MGCQEMKILNYFNLFRTILREGKQGKRRGLASFETK